MEHSPCLGIVIPVYNEQQHIAGLFKDWQKIITQLSVNAKFFFIDDGSTDGSLDVLWETAAASGTGSDTGPIPQISIHTKRNAGHGPAILDGYRLAIGCEWVFQADSDHRPDPDAFGLLWKNRDSYDFLLGERKEKHASRSRKALSSLSRICVVLLYGKGIRDVNSPYRLMRTLRLKEALARIPENSFAPNILLAAWFIQSKSRIFTTGVDIRKEGPSRKSKMTGYIFKGSMSALFQTIQFRFRL